MSRQTLLDAQRSRSIFPLSYNEFSNKSAFLFSFGGANKKVFFYQQMFVFSGEKAFALGLLINAVFPIAPVTSDTGL